MKVGEASLQDTPEGVKVSATLTDPPPAQHASDRKASSIEIVLRGVSLDSGPNRLLDDDGASLVVHERADDYVTDPTGNAGARIACGVITAR